MEFFDSHCHLDFEPLANEIEAVVERAYKADVTKMIVVGTSLRGSAKSVEIANLYPNIWASVGIHPHEAETLSDIDGAIEKLRKMTESDKVVAIGEVGLDYFGLSDQGSTISEQKEKQKKLFRAQLELANELNLPVIVHTRDAEADTLEVIQKSKFKNQNCGGVIHCFTGSPDFAKKLIDLGFYIGFTGFVTFEQDKFNHIRETAFSVPFERLIIETDAPFLAPEPYRGKQNEPAYVVEVAKKIAEIKGVDTEDVAQMTFKNTKKLFNIE